jgi:hypothetical protein
MHIEFNIDVNQYRRGVMKIVYELACRWLGATYPDDPATKAIRDFIWDKALPLDPSTKYPIRGGIQLMGNEFLMPLWTTERDHLLAASITQGRTIGVYVRVLGVFEALVQVTDDVSRYPGYTDQFVCTDPRTGATRETSFLEEVERLCNGVAG